MSILKKRLVKSKQERIINRVNNRNDKYCINVGCGTDYKKNWINIDNNSDNNIKKLDINWDLRNPLPFNEKTVDFIYHEHFIEHLTVDEGINTTRNLLRILKKGGVMRIATPDLEMIVEKYLKLPIEKDPTIKKYNMEFIKTPAERMNIGFRWWGHKWIYDWEELERRLKEAGAKKIKRCELRRSTHKELMNLETRDESTLIAEITK